MPPRWRQRARVAPAALQHTRYAMAAVFSELLHIFAVPSLHSIPGTHPARTPLP
jgi:hypothetical protein